VYVTSTAPRISRGKKVKAGAEAAAAAAGADAAEVEAAGVTAAAQAAAARKLAKKKKKIRYPKNYNPDNPGTPDPERWIPRRCVIALHISQYTAAQACRSRWLLWQLSMAINAPHCGPVVRTPRCCACLTAV
jgi:hypothetical protein